MNFHKDEQVRKILLYCWKNGSFKRWSDVEGSNYRINQAGIRMLKQGVLIKNDDGVISINYNKYPDLEIPRKVFLNMKKEGKDPDDIRFSDLYKATNFKKSTLTDLYKKADFLNELMEK